MNSEIVLFLSPEQTKEVKKEFPWLREKKKKYHHMTIKKWMREFDEKYGVKEGKPNKDTEWLLDQIFKAAEELRVDKNKKNV